MCGIAGFIDFKRNAGKFTETYKQMIHLLGRRGPDENGSYLSDRACLLHTRLAVVDLEHGKQPMKFVSGSREMVLVYNGELYNTEDLRQVLRKHGHRFRGHSDTEVLLHAYLEWGEKCTEKLNGIFAFAVWDSRKRTLFAARDRAGVKPFFYCLTDGKFIFASEIKALLCHPLVSPEIDRGGIAELLLIGPGRTPGYGVFRHIKELKPGHQALLTENGLYEKPYWQLKAAKHSESFEETMEQVRFLVKDAIRRQTVSDVPLCSFLSGGLDSSAIAALSGVRNTFSVSYKENEKYFKANAFQPDGDDIFIEEMTRFLGTKHTKIILETEDLVTALFEAVDARDLPGMADVDSSLLLFCKEVKKHATVSLSGECADEIFGGYPWYRKESILNQNQFPWSQSTAYRASFARGEIWENQNPESYVQGKYSNTVSTTEFLTDEPGKERRMKEMFRLNTEWFMQTLLDRKDRMSMYSGLEVRVPFCDHRLMEYLYNVPWTIKNDQNREKGLLRQCLKDVLPEKVLWRKKSPYPKTHHPDYLSRVSEILYDIIGTPNAPIFEFVSRDALENLLKNKNNEIPWYGQLMTVPQTIAYFIQIDAWMKKYHVRIV